MVGNPKYKVGDIVEFDATLLSNKKKRWQGVVAIVDAYGTFFDDSDASYDILIKENIGEKGANVLCKHIREDRVVAKVGEYEGSVWE